MQIRTTAAGGGQSRPFISDGVTRDANAVSNIGLTFGAWNHVAWSIVPGSSGEAGAIDVWVDAVFEGTVVYGFDGEDIGSQNNFFHIGGNGTGGFQGNMAQAIFARREWTQDDLDAMYNGGTRLTYAQLVGGSGSGDFPAGSGSGSGEFPGSGSGSGDVPGSGSGSGDIPGSGSGSGNIPGSGEFPGSGSGSGDVPCEETAFTVDQAQKLEVLKAFLLEKLNDHANGGTWNIHEFVTAAALGMRSRYDFKSVFGSPVRWCRITPIDQTEDADNVNDVRSVFNETVMVNIEYEVIIEYEWQESNQYAGSTEQQFNDLLWGRCPDGILYSLTTVGALRVPNSDEIIQVNEPDTIAKPSMPIQIYGGDAEHGSGVWVHHIDFRVQLT